VNILAALSHIIRIALSQSQVLLVYNLQVVTIGNDVGFRPYWAHVPPITAVTEQVILAALP
jgi:hypothetical protein